MNINSAILQAMIGQNLTAGGGGGCVAIVGTDIQIGTGTSNDNSQPFYGLYDYGQSQNIYLASELGASKQITGFQVYMEGFTGSYTVNNQELWIGHISQSEFDSTPALDLSDLTLSDYTQVVANFSFIFSTAGWYQLSFDTNFCYNGTDNIVVVWKNNDGTWLSGYGNTHTHTSTNRSAEKHQDDSYPTGDGTRSSNRMNMKFEY